MAITLRLAFTAFWTRCFVLIERPSQPHLAFAPSIWRTDAMRLLLAAPYTSKVEFLHGAMGQLSPKSTTFLAHRLPHIQTALRQDQLPEDQWPKPGSRRMAGKTADGNWCTAR